MGANFSTLTMVKQDRDEVREDFEAIQREQEAEGGIYSGGWNTCIGVQFTERQFKTIKDAEQWLENNTEKRSWALA